MVPCFLIRKNYEIRYTLSCRSVSYYFSLENVGRVLNTHQPSVAPGSAMIINRYRAVQKAYIAGRVPLLGDLNSFQENKDNLAFQFVW